MVNMLNSGSSGSGSSPGRVQFFCVLGQDTYVSQCISPSRSINLGTGEFNAVWQPCDGLASHLGGRRNSRNRFMLWKLKIRASLMGH